MPCFMSDVTEEIDSDIESRKKSLKKAVIKRIISFLFEMISVRYYVDLLIDGLFGFYYNSKREFISKVDDDILLRNITDLAEKIRKKELTSEKVVKAFIDRIGAVNPVINAIVDHRFKEALKEAKQIDQDIASGTISDVDFEKKPLLGIPFTSKESTACQGLSWTFGFKKRRGRTASYDADCVAAVKNAGGILLGVSNISQLDLWQETSNPVYGLTRNPYNTTKNVGGSCGGESSILAACGSPMGIGADLGGSARIPAFMCGVYGHKITNNLVPLKGLAFRIGAEPDSMISVGPMTRYADDLVTFIKVLVGKNADALQLDSPVDVNKLKVYYVTDPKDPLISPFRDEMKAVLSRAVEYFKETCSETPHELAFENLKYTTKLWKHWTSKEASNFKEEINNKEGEVNSILEVVKHFTVGGDFTTGTVLNIIIDLFKKVDEAWAVETTNSLREALLSKLDANSVLLYPSAPFSASYHHTALLRPFNSNLFSIWNVMKFPVTQVPMGLGKEGLPVGIQVVAAPFQDRLCIAVAKELEKKFGGYVPPQVVTNHTPRMDSAGYS